MRRGIDALGMHFEGQRAAVAVDGRGFVGRRFAGQQRRRRRRIRLRRVQAADVAAAQLVERCPHGFPRRHPGVGHRSLGGGDQHRVDAVFEEGGVPSAGGLGLSEHCALATGRRRLIGERQHVVGILRAVGPDGAAVDVQQTDGAVAHDERRADPAVDPPRLRHVGGQQPAGIGLHVSNHDRLPGGENPADEQFLIQRQPQPESPGIVGKAARRHQLQVAPFHQQDAGAVELDDAFELLEHCRKDLGRIEGGCDGARDLLQRGGEAPPILFGLEQAGIFDGDPRLIGDGLEQRQVFVAEVPDLGMDDGQYADDSFARLQRNANRRTRIPVAAGNGAAQPARIVPRVADQGRLPMLDDPPGQAPFVGVGQLFGGVVVELAAEGQRTFLNGAGLIENQDAPARRPNRFERQLEDVLQQAAQIELSRQLAADVIEQLQRGSGPLARSLRRDGWPGVFLAGTGDIRWNGHAPQSGPPRLRSGAV
jgi:hypothetical protein